MFEVLCSGCGKKIGIDGYTYKHENYCEKCFEKTVYPALKRSCMDDYYEQL